MPIFLPVMIWYPLLKKIIHKLTLQQVTNVGGILQYLDILPTFCQHVDDMYN